jgi:hypothetical protein
MGVCAFPDLDQHNTGQYILKYSRKIDAQVTWVDIIPHLWSHVIKEGDEIRIFTVNEPDPPPSRDDTPHPLITFRYDWYQGEGSLKKLNRRFATTLLPNTYEVQRILALTYELTVTHPLSLRMHRISSSRTWAPSSSIRSRTHWV